MNLTNQFEKRHEIVLLDEWRERFKDNTSLRNLFTPTELQLFPGKPNTGSLAGRYIVKSLLFNYLKIEGNFQDIEILSDEFGKPMLGMSDQLKELGEQSGIQSICCSISHSRKRVVGMITIEKTIS